MKTDYLCPICSEKMIAVRGNMTDSSNGWTVYCGNRNCTAQEVSGHGRNVELAFQVVREKFSFAKNKSYN